MHRGGISTAIMFDGDHSPRQVVTGSVFSSSRPQRLQLMCGTGSPRHPSGAVVVTCSQPLQGWQPNKSLEHNSDPLCSSAVAGFVEASSRSDVTGVITAGLSGSACRSVTPVATHADQQSKMSSISRSLRRARGIPGLACLRAIGPPSALVPWQRSGAYGPPSRGLRSSARRSSPRPRTRRCTQQPDSPAVLRSLVIRVSWVIAAVRELDRSATPGAPP